MEAFKLVYVTGAPASGKSSTMALLRKRLSDLRVWEYGAELTEFLRERGGDLRSQVELRTRSSDIAQPSDIEELDERLLKWAATSRITSHAIIDSHPVTRENYGFRVTAFSATKVKQLRPSEIWLFYVAPEVTLSRISTDPAGRPTISLEEARMHSAAQASVACTFGITVGCPVYMFDTDVNQADLVDGLAARLAN